jgi:hypothetical protein
LPGVEGAVDGAVGFEVIGLGLVHRDQQFLCGAGPGEAAGEQHQKGNDESANRHRWVR